MVTKKKVKLIYKLATHFIISYALFITQTFVFMAANSSSAEAVEQANPNLKAEVAKANTQAQQQKEHDEKSNEVGKSTISECSTASEVASFNQTQAIRYQQGILDANLNGIRQARQELSQSTSSMNQAQGSVAGNAGNSMDPQTGQTYKEIFDTYNETRVEYQEKGAIKIQKENTWNQWVSRCTFTYDYFCTPSQREAKENARMEYDAAVASLAEVTPRWNSSRANYNRIKAGQAATGRNATASASNMQSNDAAQDASNVEAGIVADRYSNLTSIYNRATVNSQRLAAEQLALLRDMENKATYQGDFQLFESALDDFDPNFATNALSAGSNYYGYKMAFSNLLVTAMTGSAAKDLSCNPHSMSVSDGQVVDSSSYHIFKAASATYLMAEINNTGYYKSTSSCRLNETFSDAYYDPACATMDKSSAEYKIKCMNSHKNMQVLALERATNLYDEMFTNMCITMTPDASNASLKAECDEVLTEVYGDQYKDSSTGEYIRTKELALKMYEQALEAALSEQQDKVKKVTTAYSKVLRGEAWIEKNESQIITTTTLIVLTSTMMSIFFGICAIPFGGSWACPIGVWWKGIWTAYGVYMAYLVRDLLKARDYTALWRQKLEKAQFYTHLKCNQTQAFAEAQGIQDSAENYRQQVKDRLEEAKNEILNIINPGAIEGEQIQEPTDTTAHADIFKYDFDLNEKIMASSDKNHHKSVELSALNFIRSLNGATSSLPYNVKLPTGKNMNRYLAQAGVEIKKVAVTGMNFLLDQVVGKVQASADTNLSSSLGIATGSSSFMYFVTTRNRAWQDQSLDVTAVSPEGGALSYIHSETSNASGEIGRLTLKNASTNKRITAAVNPRSSVTGFLSIDHLPAANQTGFPTPDTRIITIRRIIDAINENLILSQTAIVEIADQRAAYSELLKRMKLKMKLEAGMDNLNVTARPNLVGQCMKDVGNGKMEVDKECACKKSSSCATFSYPDLSAFTGSVGSSGNLAIDVANSISANNMSGTTAAANSIGQNALKVKKSIFAKEGALKKIMKKAGVNRDYRKIAQSQNSASLDGSRIAYNALNSDVNNIRSKLGLNSKALRRAQKLSKNKKNVVANAKNKVASKINSKLQANKKASVTASSGNSDSKKGLFDDFNMDIDMSGVGATGNFLKDDANNNAIEEAQKERSTGRSGMRYARNSKSWDKSVNKNRQKSLFKIISRRYKKSAYPVFLKKRSPL